MLTNLTFRHLFQQPVIAVYLTHTFYKLHFLFLIHTLCKNLFKNMDEKYYFIPLLPLDTCTAAHDRAKGLQLTVEIPTLANA